MSVVVYGGPLERDAALRRQLACVTTEEERRALEKKNRIWGRQEHNRKTEGAPGQEAACMPSFMELHILHAHEQPQPPA
jgi:hypothetical protein